MRLVLVTCPPDKAEGIADALVAARLVACVNIVPGLTSVYRWKGKVEKDAESLLLLKTTVDRLEELRLRLVELHPYEVPEFIAFEIAGGHAPYLDWIGLQTTPA